MHEDKCCINRKIETILLYQHEKPFFSFFASLFFLCCCVLLLLFISLIPYFANHFERRGTWDLARHHHKIRVNQTVEIPHRERERERESREFSFLLNFVSILSQNLDCVYISHIVKDRDRETLEKTEDIDAKKRFFRFYKFIVKSFLSFKVPDNVSYCWFH